MLRMTVNGSSWEGDRSLPRWGVVNFRYAVEPAAAAITINRLKINTRMQPVSGGRVCVKGVCMCVCVFVFSETWHCTLLPSTQDTHSLYIT